MPLAVPLTAGQTLIASIEVVDRGYKQALMDIKRPFAWLWATMEIFSPSSAALRVPRPPLRWAARSAPHKRSSALTI